MIKKYCDRCKKELKPQDTFNKVEIKYGSRLIGVCHPIDLCEICRASFGKAINDFLNKENDNDRK